MMKAGIKPQSHYLLTAVSDVTKVASSLPKKCLFIHCHVENETDHEIGCRVNTRNTV